MAEEIRLHLEQRASEFVAQGLTPEQARAAAHRQFGPVEPVKEACRDERRRVAWLETTWQDLRYGARSLARDRAFTITAILTLTLGVGLVTTFVTIFNAILLKPWPLREPDTLVTTTRGVPPVVFRHLRERAASVDLVAMAQICGSSIEDEPVRTNFRCVSGNYFDILRVPLIHGRGFRPDEDIIGAPVPVAVIGYALWRDRFGLSPDIIGRTIRLNQVPFQIVGIAGQGAIDKPAKNLPRLWVPLAAYSLIASDSEFARGFLVNPEYCCVELAGRLRDPWSHAAASAELTALRRQFAGSERESAITIVGTREIDQPWEDSGVAFIGLVGAGLLLVLLVACANTGNLQLARGSRRQNEFLVRLSLGASRRRLVRQLLTEGLMIAVAAASLSLAFAVGLTSLLVRGVTEADQRAAGLGIDLSPDWFVAVVTLSVAVVAVLTTALGPALRGTRRLIASSRSSSAPIRARAWFVVIQVALSAVLIVGASLLARALQAAATVDPGFDAEGVARVTVILPSGISSEPRLQALRDAVRDALTAVGPRLVAEAGGGRVTVSNLGESRKAVHAEKVSPEYLPLLGVPLKQGRLLRDGDTPSEVVVNEAFARWAWPDRSAVGATFDLDGARLVVGVVGDIRPTRPNTAVTPTFFEPGTGRSLYVRNEAPVLDRARAAITTIEPAAEIRFTPLTEGYEFGLEGMRIGTTLAWALGLVALAMAATGIFGVFALVAEERRREVGIRLALGAGSRAIVRMMLTHAGRATIIGLVVGLVAALIAAPLLRSYLVGIGPYDPIAFAVAALVLVSASAAATYIPVRRALHVDPAVTLRAE
jgi:predicted permease